jgi:PAS domain S-box-containing protein
MPEPIVVLHVDDDADFAAITADFLERENDAISVVTETTVTAGLERLEQGGVDCIVSDYDMPDLDGLDFLERVRDRYPELPFILFTGKGSEEVASDAFSMGATDYLQKQVRSDQATLLANRVENYVETARAEAERTRHLQAIETAKEGIAIVDDDGEFVFVNEACAALYGYDATEMVGKTWEEFHEPDELERIRTEVLPSLFAQGEWHGRTIGLRADGSTVVEERTLSLTDQDEVICSVREVDTAAESHLYERIVEGMGDGVYAMDAEGRLIEANENIAEVLGIDRDDLRGSTPERFFDEEDIETFEAAIADLLERDERATTTVAATARRPDDHDVPIEVTLTLLPSEDGEFHGTIGVVRDVRDSRERERERQQYETMIETMADGVYVLDPEGVVTEVNESLVDLIGDPYDEIVGHPAEKYFEEADAERFDDAIRTLLREDETRVTTVEAKLHASGDRVIPVETRQTLVPSPTGEYEGTVGVVRDMSDRWEREQELERYELLLELMPDTVVVTDMEGMLTEIHGYEGWSGYDYGELVGEDMGKTMTGEDVERAIEVVSDLVRSDDRSKATFEQQTITKDGESIPHENHITLLPPDDDGTIPGTMSVLRDISDRVEREAELERQNERLEEFAAIVSHDLRNPLNVAAGRLALAMDECDSDHLEAVARSHDRMEDLIEDLLGLARERYPATDVEPVEIRAVVEAAWNNVDTTEATLELAADGTIEADESRVKQLVENLVRNAIDHGGEDVTVRVGELADGSGFYVADDGPGIPQGERGRVFESGYTTDPEGTGFGLSIVREVAEAHDWDIDVTDAADGGARFEFTCDHDAD